ncbi:MAG: molybdopterin molybdotransferase MoeA [Actinomycetota bacterium]
MDTTLLELDEGRRRILGGVQPLQPIDLPLAEAHGCVLARDVATEYDMPPFSSAVADGFAVRAADIHGATADTPVELRVSGWALPGRAPGATVGWGEAVGVAAGAPLPAGADGVVPSTSAESEGDVVRVRAPVDAGSNIRPAGEDLPAGSVLVPGGRRLSAPEMGALATGGFGSALVYPRVRVSVVSVGRALIEPGRPAAFGQVRDANSFALVGALRDVGAVPYRIPIVQDLESELREVLLSDLARSDAFICSGAMGEDDGQALATALAGMGDVTTYRTAMFPGGTVGFGLLEGKPFFSLPEDPVAVFVAFEVFVRPAILKTMGRRDVHRPEVEAVLEQEVTGPAGLTLYLPARVSHRQGSWRALPTGPAAANLQGALVQANGLVVIPAGDTALGAGERVRVQIFRPLER